MKRKKVRVGAVSYLNAKPLINGLENGLMQEELDLIIDHPAAIAQLLIDDKIDMGLVPVAVIPMLKEHHIVTDFCIGCNGEVVSVCLFSDVPIQEVHTILLDYQSKTSVALLKLLLNEHWKISPVLVNAVEGYEKNIKDGTAGLVIGDRAFEQRLHATYMYDLGLIWKEMTGMPFVFAAWVSNKKLDNDFLHAFNLANKKSLEDITAVLDKNPSTVFDLGKYFREHIAYDLDAEKKMALEYFLDKITADLFA